MLYAMSRAASFGFALTLALSVFLMDQGLKKLIEGSMRLGENIPIIPDILYLTYVKNAGGAFGILDGRGGVLLLGSAIAVVFVLWMLFEGPPTRTTTLGCGLILGGAAGNLLDRLTSGEVTDYVYFTFWYVFNIADAAIVFGTVVLLFTAFRPGKADQKKQKPTADL
jgi:signal peptidase II